MSTNLRSLKRKRTMDDDDVENSAGLGPSRVEHRRKRARDSPPVTPTPLSPHNRDTPESSPKHVKQKENQQVHSLHATISLLNEGGMVDLMVETGSHSDIDTDYFARHPNLTPHMRSVLFDWLSEVCVAYKLRRESYYLALNFFDRYMSKTSEVQKSLLQLIGVTCLFIAVKIEEIYPPKVNDLAYVTNETCSGDEIITQELAILATLEWNLTTLTINGWLGLLLQLWHNRTASYKTLIFPNHPVKDYQLCALLLDLVILEEGSLMFSYESLAAAAIHSMTDFKDVISSPPLEHETRAICECVSWMKPFADVIREKMSPRKVFADLDKYMLQTRQFELLELLEEARKRMQPLQYSSVLMTPPPSSEKPSTSFS